MKSFLLCLVIAVAAHQASAITVTKNWQVPIILADTINTGDTIVWNWTDTAPHDVQFLTYPTGFQGVATNGVVGLTVPPAPVRAPYNVSFTPTLAGNYTYVCSVHPSMTGVLTVRAAAANSTTPAAANATVPATANATASSNATTTNITSNATAVQAAVVARTLGFATAAVNQNATAVLGFITTDFTAFAFNVSGPLTIANATALLGYFQQNLAIAARNSPLANTTAPVVKQFILNTPTNALITVQVPILQHFATILWTYLNNTNYTANWYARTGVFTPAPVSVA